MADKARCCTSPSTVAPSKCPHLAVFKDGGGLQAFSTILKYIFTSRALACMKLPPPKCQECHNSGGRLHACLQCVFFACWDQGHLTDHFKQENHFLGVDVNHTEIYCHKCGDYVYDVELDAIVNSEYNKVNEQNQKLLDSNRASYLPWKATKDDHNTISKNSQPLKFAKNSLGLRGLINLGNTCFMNCILQSFVHNPLMRNYFLSDRHNNKECRLKYRNNVPQDSDGNSNEVCLGCEMDVLFGQVFSGAKNPYTPHSILHSIWKFSNYFAGYEQQDAHEFLISSLNGLHSHLERTTLMKETENNHNSRQHNSNHKNGSPPRGGEKCDCIVHTIFKGTMRSEVTCSECGFSSVTEDPFFDISLDIPKAPPASSHNIPPPAPAVAPETNPITSTPPMSPSQAPLSPNSISPIQTPSPQNPKTGTKRNADDETLLSPPVTSPRANSPIPPPQNSKLFDNTLTACLERFTQPERLGSDEKFLCSHCHTRQESTKQLSMKSLPVVICFHLKRFEQLANSRHSNKVDTFIEFPSILDMSPYTSLHLKASQNAANNTNNKTNKRQKSNGENQEDAKAPDDMFSYQLFAVVNHHGKMDTGHYISYVKHENTWYKCDDATITVATLPQVMRTKGYLLFYMKNHLQYGSQNSNG